MVLANPTAVVLELMTMAQQSAVHLADLLRAASPAPPPEHQELAAEILGCCGRVTAALTSAAGNKRKEPECPLPATPPKRRARGAEPAIREVKSSTTADGFFWRKYGQKDINGCKHPRLYYRCAYRDQGCAATRRLQRSPEEPAAYVITYYGEHSCRDGGGDVGREAAPQPAVIDFGGANDWSRGSPLPRLSAQQRCCDDGEAPGGGETSKGWSSPSSSSEPDQEARGCAVPGGDDPWYASPGMEFLDDYSCFDWELDSLDLGGLSGLHHLATF